jgi:hypothetical protein
MRMSQDNYLLHVKKISVGTCIAGNFCSILAAIKQVRVTLMKKTLLLISALMVGAAGINNAAAQDRGNEELVSVWRWYNTADRTFQTVAEGEYQDGQMINWGWKDKTMLFVAYRNPGENRVAVYSWTNPVTKDQVSMTEDEFTDDQMIKMGYTGKKIQYYGATRRGPNTIAVYRWVGGKNIDWVTIPEEGDTDAYYKKGYRHKTFQYFGIPRSMDVKIYNQL